MVLHFSRYPDFLFTESRKAYGIVGCKLPSANNSCGAFWEAPGHQGGHAHYVVSSAWSVVAAKAPWTAQLLRASPAYPQVLRSWAAAAAHVTWTPDQGGAALAESGSIGAQLMSKVRITAYSLPASALEPPPH